MSHLPSHTIPAVPEPIATPTGAKLAAMAATVLGAAAFAWALIADESQLAWSAYLIGMFFTLGLGVFGVAWLAILYLARGEWSVTMRRIPEAMTAWLLPGAVLAMAVGLGAQSLYHWSHTEAVASDPLLLHKSPFLNLTMFALLVGVSLALWIGFATLFVRTSHWQDRDGGMGPSRMSNTLSAIFLVVFALTFSVISFYFLLSLEAHWFSTMFAVLVFTDVIQTGTAFVAIVAGWLLMAGKLDGFLNRNHMHSLGKMVFASTGFWAYIYFCQFMLIWYANLPEETIYFLRRSEHGWQTYLLILSALKFVIPFLLLIPRDAKRNPRKLIPLSLLILFAQFWELYLMVGPAMGHGAEAAPAHLPVIELAVTLGFLGLFTLVFGWALERHDPVPLKDPALAACLQYQS